MGTLYIFFYTKGAIDINNIKSNTEIWSLELRRVSSMKKNCLAGLNIC